MKNSYFFGKNAVITGAASGIGREIALQLAKLGTNVIISDINIQRLDQVKAELEKSGVKVNSYHCDVTKKNEVKALLDHAVSDFKDIHFLFSNAGIAIGGQFEFFLVEQWKSIINTNLWGCINVVSAFLPKMLQQGFGHVIVTSSIAGIIGVGGLVPYSTTKFANYGFCEAIYGEFHEKGIEVSVICPFPLKTNLIETAQFSLDPEKIKNISQEKLQDIVNMGKKYFWEEFTKEGMDLEEAVKIYLKKIAKKRFYICEKGLARLAYFIKGIWPSFSKKIVQKVGTENYELLDASYQMCYDAINKELNSKT